MERLEIQIEIFFQYGKISSFRKSVDSAVMGTFIYASDAKMTTNPPIASTLYESFMAQRQLILLLQLQIADFRGYFS